MNTPSPAHRFRPGFLAAFFGAVPVTLAFVALTIGMAAADAPSISVTQGLTALTAGSSTVTFPAAVVSGSPTSLTFSITNPGTLPLNITGATIDGANGADFAVTSPSQTTLIGNGDPTTSTFTVTFTPSVGGSRIATLHIYSNDTTKNPFNVTLTGTGQAPQIALQQPAGTALTAGTSTVTLPAAVVGGSPTSLTFTVLNKGTATLSITGLTVDGTNSSEFLPAMALPTNVAANGTSTFTVTFTPLAGGTRTATLHVASNDATTGSFNINLTGYAAESALPVISVDDPDGYPLTATTGTADCGSCLLGSSQTLTFTIHNNGVADLTSLVVTVTRHSGAANEDYTVTSPLATTVAGGNSTTFTVVFKPLSHGECVGTVRVMSNDLTQQPFKFSLTGIGMSKPQPLLAVSLKDSPSLMPNPKADLGSSYLPVSPSYAGPNTQTFTIKNTGLAGLTGIVAATTNNGIPSTEFTVTASPASTLAAGDSTDFTVTFTPAGNGLRTATLRIKSNDSRHNPFNIALTGTGMAPVIAVEAPTGTSLVPGKAKINFGTSLASKPVLLTFTIRNTGGDDLTLPTPTVDGTNSADFTVISPPLASVAAGASTTFTVRYLRASAGKSTAALHIASNDPLAARSPFNIALTGAALASTAAMMDVQDDHSNSITPGDDFNFGPTAVNSPVSRNFLVKNILLSGGNLKLSKVGISGPNAAEFKVTATYQKTIAPTMFTTFAVTFTPKSAGAKEAMLTILSNAPGQSPFTVRLLGNNGASATSIPGTITRNVAKAAVLPRVAAPAMSAAVVAAARPVVVADGDAAMPASGDVGTAPGGYFGGGVLDLLALGAAELDPFAEIVNVAGQDWPAISFQRWIAPGSLIYQVEESTDAVTWTAVPTPWQIAGPIVDDGDGSERITVLASAPVTPDHVCYLRVRVRDGL